jgi:hypothetical protein
MPLFFALSLLDFSNPKSARLISYWLIIGVIGLFAATASTPVHRNSPSVKDKYMVRGLASLGAILIPSYIGHLAYKQDFLDCLPLGLFIGLPFTIIASIKFHEIFQRLSQDRLRLGESQPGASGIDRVC